MPTQQQQVVRSWSLAGCPLQCLSRKQVRVLKKSLMARRSLKHSPVGRIQTWEGGLKKLAGTELATSLLVRTSPPGGSLRFSHTRCHGDGAQRSGIFSLNLRISRVNVTERETGRRVCGVALTCSKRRNYATFPCRKSMNDEAGQENVDSGELPNARLAASIRR